MERATTRIDPGYEPHRTLEQDVTDYLEDNNYQVTEATYHAVLPKKAANILSRNYSWTGLYLRTRADRAAFHPLSQDAFEWESKTHSNPKKHDMAFEALPFAHHLMKARLGVRCLYCYRSPFDGRDYGFWMDNPPPVEVVLVPSHIGGIVVPGEWKTRFREMFGPLFGREKIRFIGRVGGSGDPFVLIEEEEKRNLPDWRDLVNQ